MKSRWWIAFCLAWVLPFTASAARAQGNGHGNGHGRGHDKDRGEDYDRDSRARYDDRDREVVRGWYAEHDRQGGLPPGLAKRDQLPPGLEKQLVVRGELPPGLRKKIQPVPEDLVRELPPPPPDCEHVVIGGHIVLMNSKTSVVLDILHLEF